MNKQESLAFLQSCIEKVKKATEKDIQFYKEVYNEECISTEKESKFQFVFPSNDFKYKYEINEVFELDACNQDIRKTEKSQMEYNFLGVSSINQQNNSNLPYAA